MPLAPLCRAPRLAYLVSRYPAVSHTFILREVQQLRAAGCRIAVASINPPDQAAGQMEDAERAEAAATYYVKQHGWRGALLAHLTALRRPCVYLRGAWGALRLAGADLRRLAYAPCYFTEALMLARWLERQQLQHLHVHFASAAASVALVLRQFHPASLSLTVHGPDEFYDAPGQRLPAKIAAADFIICISDFARSQLMHLAPAAHWNKLQVCRLGVDTLRYQPQRTTAAGAPFTILCVGRLTPAKGQRLLLDACHRLRLAGHQLRLVLVGSGPDEAALRTHVARHRLQPWVQFTGALNQEQVRAQYASADAFALASFAEGIPVVLMEAMACGLPVVAPRITGIPELIRDGEDGLLVAPGNCQQLAAALLRLLHDSALRQRLGANGRQRVSAEYQLQRNARQLAQLFHHHLGEPA